MNMTTSTGAPAKSPRPYVLPSTAGSRKSGQGAPSFGAVLSTAIARRKIARTSEPPRQVHVHVTEREDHGRSDQASGRTCTCVPRRDFSDAQMPRTSHPSDARGDAIRAWRGRDVRVMIGHADE